MEMINSIKDKAKHLFYSSGLAGLLIRIARERDYPKLVILVYHRASKTFEDCPYMGIPADILEQHMKFIKDNFRVVSMEDGIEKLYGSDKKEVYAAVNFDDGYMDNYIHAYPVLKKHAIPATIYLTTDYIGKNHVFWWDMTFNSVQKSEKSDSINNKLREKEYQEIEKELSVMKKKTGQLDRPVPSRMLGWGEIKEMKNNGINFGSHTKTHKNICLLSDKEVMDELLGSKKEIEKNLIAEAGEFSYPFGIFDERVKAMAREAGFRYARANLKKVNNKNADRFALASICAGNLMRTSHLASRISMALAKRTV